jgi:tRNA acetyltransferase TAN1
MQTSFNLLASTFRYKEQDAAAELLDVLEGFGDFLAEFGTTEISGIFLARTNLDPFKVIDKIKALVHNEAWRIRFILRLIPIELVVRTGLEEIRSAVSQLSSKMQNEETFRITVEKRHNPVQTYELITAIATKLDNKVQLEGPDWIVLVEVAGPLTGISIIRRDQIFSSIIEKRNCTIV